MNNWPVMNDSREEMELDRFKDRSEVESESIWPTIGITIMIPVALILVYIFTR